MDIQKIKELALANGFKLKEQASGNMDLNAYVYDFANAIEREAKSQANKQFENFIDQAIEDSACADERRALQTLLEDFQDNFKDQAIPDGFVLVPKEPTQELLNKMQDFFVGAFESGLTGGQSIHCAYIAMIEARESANESE